MLNDISAALASQGLNLNADKCMIQSNRKWKKPIKLGDVEVRMASATEGFKILGTQLALEDTCDTELTMRIAAGWSKYHASKSVLCKKKH